MNCKAYNTNFGCVNCGNCQISKIDDYDESDNIKIKQESDIEDIYFDEDYQKFLYL